MKSTVKIPVADLLPPASELAQAAGRAVFNTVKRHLAKKDAASSPAPGMPRSGYWGDAALATMAEWNGKTYLITIPKEGVALHFYGGTVRPGPDKKALAIPKDPAVAGMRPAEYDPLRKKLHLVWKKDKTAGTLRDKDGRVHYLLVPKAVIPEDPDVLPSEDEMYEAAKSAMEALC